MTTAPTARELVPLCSLAAVLASGCSQEHELGHFGSGETTESGGDGDESTGSTESGSSTTTSESSSGSTESDSGTTDDDTKFDVEPEATTGEECGCGNDEWSYLWVANSSESTVAKIDTRTVTEEGRYLTRADAAGNPSRTSVSVDGKAVAVANRHVGLVKLWARPELCDEDKNGQVGLQTSSGPDDVLPFGEDDCLAWYVDFPGMSAQRPVAWTAGELDEGTCQYVDQKVWTVTAAGGAPGKCGQNQQQGAWVHRLDGESGEIEDTVHISGGDAPCIGGAPTDVGPYGAAVDTDGNLWINVMWSTKLLRVDFETLQVDVYPNGLGFLELHYGITVDTQGRPWFTGSALRRFDPETETWAEVALADPHSGIAQDHQDRIWAGNAVGNSYVLQGWDVETMQSIGTIDLPILSKVKGVSVDIDGYVWVVPFFDNTAYKVDPDAMTWEVYAGLDGPYTYSDMSGGQLSNVTCMPAG